MPQNACRYCKHTWFPRGAKMSARCPSCGRTDGVELAVVLTASDAEAAAEDERVKGYNQKTSQIRWLILAFLAIVAFLFLAGAFDAYFVAAPTGPRGR